MSSLEDVREHLEERPDLEPAFEAVLEPEPPFTFDDVAVDSGTFGELVSRGIVERTDGGFRVVDPEAVRRGLSGDVPEERGSSLKAASIPGSPVSRLELLFLAGAIALVVVFRLIALPNVYHDGYVVFPSNDPYYYRFFVDVLLTNPDVTPSNLVLGISRGEPLFVTVLWLVSTALGGTPAVARHVLAWYPVVSAVVLATFLYVLVIVVTDDRRIGLAALAMLAVIPGNAVLTSLGFADHHAFDYVWLTLTLLGITVIAREARRERSPLSPMTTVAAGTVAIGVAGQTLAWDNSAILLAAPGVYIGFEGLRSVHAGDRPSRTIGPVVAGLGVGAGLAWFAHLRLGWHTTLVASAPTLLTLGGVGVLIGAELVSRLHLGGPRAGADRSVPVLAALEAIGLLLGAFVLRTVRPSYWERLTTGLQERLLAPRPIAEVLGLFGSGQDWLLLLGFALFIGVPYLLWATVHATGDGRWLPPVTYCWYFLALSVIQVRFVGEFALLLAPFLGLGLVHLAERIDVARRPAPFTGGEPPELSLPTRRQFGAMALLFLLVGSLGIVQVYTETSQVTPSPAQSDAAIWMAEYSDERGLEYPSNYVFSQWGRNRMYNYFVSGNSHSYDYAQTNYQDFVRSTDPEAWYGRLGNRRGFVVTTSAAVGGPNELGTRLHRHRGLDAADTPALAHYQFLHETGGGAFKIFRVVPGAVIRGSTEPDVRVRAHARVAVGKRTYSYDRWTTANASGAYRVRVAQPGEYRIAETTVTVNETAVNQGMTVPAN